MKSVVSTVWHVFLEKNKGSRWLARVYRALRIASQYLEEKSPEISQKAGFAHDMGWLEDLGFEPRNRR